uniref:J domain-containing protein n=1 Tax=Alexandrium catenella TaxID=2925 RepID=A0A7S1S8G4_ALECA|mmetsp:Transcript_90697/g.240966  ORF Transcript_90697/g.240966 Transcript_90697/m.240966 type:complete len:231 (+) Transcript_90697:55-747(+)
MEQGKELGPHELLRVEVGAAPATIRACFIREAKRWHPDKRPPGESEEEREAARARFVAVHAAYEALSSAAAESLDYQVGGSSASIAAACRGSAKAVEEARARREEAEEYLNELRSGVLQGQGWAPEEREVLQATWRRAFRAVEAFRREEMAAQVAFDYGMALEADTNVGSEAMPKTAEKAALDGPRTFGDHIDGVGTAFNEIFEDVCGGYFAAWKAVRPRWLRGLAGAAA